MAMTGWGRNRFAHVLAARPERIGQAIAAFQETIAKNQSILACGAARSYGDVHLNDGNRAILTTRLNRFLSFNPKTGDLAAEAGMTFRELLDVFLPKGFLVPVTPGTAYATLGGAVANDVHGKNHDAVGSFGHHVQWLDLMLPSGEITRISPEARPELFHATIGGLGLTGIILAVGLNLIRVPSNAMNVTERRMKSLDDFLAAFTGQEIATGYSVGWIDALAFGGSVGRGILETATPAPESIPTAARKSHAVPVDLPPFLLNRQSVSAFNAWYWRRVPAQGRQRTVTLDRFLYPLNSLLNWNRIYGRPGFYQFQCVLPPAEAPKGLVALLETIQLSGNPSFLAVLKSFGDHLDAGYLSFPMRGITLALDFPRRSRTDEFMQKLERIVRNHGGRIYLAKDSCLSAEGFREMYKGLPAFRSVLEQIDPASHMDSDMARRLKIRAAA